MRDATPLMANASSARMAVITAMDSSVSLRATDGVDEVFVAIVMTLALEDTNDARDMLSARACKKSLTVCAGAVQRNKATTNPRENAG